VEGIAMGQEDHYEIDGSKDAKEYYWTGAKGEKRAYGKAYADAHSNKGWNDQKGYMENVGKGGIKYTQARMSEDADWEDVKHQSKKPKSRKRLTVEGPTLSRKKSAKKKATKKQAARKR
jgi:hypothetical protein